MCRHTWACISNAMRTILLSLLLCASASAQSWHGHSVQPGSTTPQCMVRSDPDGYGFTDCRLLTQKFSPEYLRRRDVIIWTPPRYRLLPTGKEWYIWQAAEVGATVADEEYSQAFLHSAACRAPGASCREENPLLGNTRAQAYSVLAAWTTLAIWTAYKQRRYWRARETVGISAWDRGFWAHFYHYRTIDAVYITAHVVGIVATERQR